MYMGSIAGCQVNICKINEIKLVFCILAQAIDFIPIKRNYLKTGQVHISTHNSHTQFYSTNKRPVRTKMHSSNWIAIDGSAWHPHQID